MSEKIKIGVSSCLLGNEVRYDGGHTRDRYVVDVLGEHLELVPICPEVESGMPIPREPIHLEGDPTAPRLVTRDTGVDITESMLAWCHERGESLEPEGLCGYVFKAKSPSCGVGTVKVYDSRGEPHRVGTGLFARAFQRRFPLVPVEEAERLDAPRRREAFVESVFVLARWRQLAADPTPERVVTFHTEHKMVLRSHGEERYRALGRVCARAGAGDLAEVVASYQEGLVEALRRPATVEAHVNVLEHAMGHLKSMLSREEKRAISEEIEGYRQDVVPLVVPLSLLSHYARLRDEPYLRRQRYLNPHPVELKLRNHA